MNSLKLLRYDFLDSLFVFNILFSDVEHYFVLVSSDAAQASIATFCRNLFSRGSAKESPPSSLNFHHYMFSFRRHLSLCLSEIKLLQVPGLPEKKSQQQSCKHLFHFFWPDGPNPPPKKKKKKSFVQSDFDGDLCTE